MIGTKTIGGITRTSFVDCIYVGPSLEEQADYLSVPGEGSPVHRDVLFLEKCVIGVITRNIRVFPARIVNFLVTDLIILIINCKST